MYSISLMLDEIFTLKYRETSFLKTRDLLILNRQCKVQMIYYYKIMSQNLKIDSFSYSKEICVVI